MIQRNVVEMAPGTIPGVVVSAPRMWPKGRIRRAWQSPYYAGMDDYQVRLVTSAGAILIPRDCVIDFPADADRIPAVSAYIQMIYDHHTIGRPLMGVGAGQALIGCQVVVEIETEG